MPSKRPQVRIPLPRLPLDDCSDLEEDPITKRLVARHPDATQSTVGVPHATERDIARRRSTLLRVGAGVFGVILCGGAYAWSVVGHNDRPGEVTYSAAEWHSREGVLRAALQRDISNFRIIDGEPRLEQASRLGYARTVGGHVMGLEFATHDNEMTVIQTDQIQGSPASLRTSQVTFEQIGQTQTSPGAALDLAAIDDIIQSGQLVRIQSQRDANGQTDLEVSCSPQACTVEVSALDEASGLPAPDSDANREMVDAVLEGIELPRKSAP